MKGNTRQSSFKGQIFTTVKGVYVKRLDNSGHPIFFFSYMQNGKQQHRFGGTLEEAIIKRAHALDQLRSGGLPSISSRTQASPAAVAVSVNQICEDFTRARSSRRVASRHKLSSDHVTRILGSLDASTLRTFNLRAYVSKRQREGVRNSTISAEFRFFRAALNFQKKLQAENGAAFRNVFDSLDREEWASLLPDQAPVHTYDRSSAEEQAEKFERVIALLPDRYRAPVKLALEIGARKGEIFGLLWGEVHGDEIRFTDRVKMGKKNRAPIPLPAGVLALLPARPANAKATDLVFPGPDGGSMYNSVPKAWSLATREAGCPELHLHDARREFVSRKRAEGIPDNLIAAVTGHSSATMTALYDRVAKADLRRAMGAKTLLTIAGNGAQMPHEKVVER